MYRQRNALFGAGFAKRGGPLGRNAHAAAALVFKGVQPKAGRIGGDLRRAGNFLRAGRIRKTGRPEPGRRVTHAAYLLGQSSG